jgi:hypothetical protein
MRWIAHFDESGTHDQSPLLVMGMTLSTVEKWEAFNEEWGALLAREGVPYFHFADLIGRRKPHYNKFKNSIEVQSLIDECAGLIERHLEMSCISLLKKSDYQAFYRERDWNQAKLPRDSALGVLFRASVSWIPIFLERAGLDDDPVIDFVYEAGVKNAGDLQRLFQLFKQRAPDEWKRRLGCLTFAKKGEACGLEASDCLSIGALRQELSQHGGGNTLIEESEFTVPTQDDLPPGSAPSFRLPIGKEVLESLYDQILLETEDRRRYAAERLRSSRGS